MSKKPKNKLPDFARGTDPSKGTKPAMYKPSLRGLGGIQEKDKNKVPKGKKGRSSFAKALIKR